MSGLHRRSEALAANLLQRVRQLMLVMLERCVTASAISTEVVSNLAVLENCTCTVCTVQRVHITDLVVGLF